MLEWMLRMAIVALQRMQIKKKTIHSATTIKMLMTAPLTWSTGGFQKTTKTQHNTKCMDR